MSRPPKSSDGDYEVGYGRPPVATRFAPGQSGNPKGRPKKPATVGDELREIMMTRHKVTENGRTKTYTLQSIILRGIASEAARKNFRAIGTLFKLMERFGQSDETVLDPTDLAPEDRDILQSFLASASTASASGSPIVLDGPSSAPSASLGKEPRS